MAMMTQRFSNNHRDRKKSPVAAGLIILILSLFVAGCSPRQASDSEAPASTETQSASNDATAVAEAPAQPAVQPEPGAPQYIETGDLADIQRHGTIRLIIPRWSDAETLPREGFPTQVYRDLATGFVDSLGLELQWIPVSSYQDMITALLEGRGDLIVANLTHTDDRDKAIGFSLPLTQTNEVIITPANTTPLTGIENLQGKTIAVGTGTSFEETLKKVADSNPSVPFTLKALNDVKNPDTLLDRLVKKEFDATVLDNNIAAAVAAYRDDIQLNFDLNDIQNIAWATRPDAKELLTRLNLYITQTLTTSYRGQRFTDDFAAIKKRKTLRMLTRNSPTNYFLWRGELMGFEYDLVKKFADEHQLKLEVVVAPAKVDMIEWLKEGKADLIAAAMTILPERTERGIAFTRPYNKIGEQLAYHRDSPPLTSLEDLAGKTITVRQNTAYWHTAEQWLKQGHEFTLQPATDNLNTDEILAQVASGELKATLADSHLIAIEQRFHEALVTGYLQEPMREHGWAVRDNNPELLTALNQFLKKHYRGLFFNVTYNKYFKNKKRIGKYQGQRLNQQADLSPYDAKVKELASVYSLDWRLVIAQMYQESRFDPNARSFAGAEGLLQVLPRTAKEMGYTVPFTETSGIEAGMQYLNWVRDRFEKTLPLQERIWFTLASYNAGYGHVYDARRLASQQGMNPDVWFGNVENAMLLLSHRKHYQKARFGYVRGREPVNYVREIRERYQAYLALKQ